jgi:phosphoglycolate phosphatase
VNILEEINAQKTRLIMFDLDGTLVDSVPDLAFAVDAMLLDMGRPFAGLLKVEKWVGNGAAMLVKRALSDNVKPVELDKTVYDEAYALFLKYYQQVNGKKSQLYPKVLETLSQLRQAFPYLAIITNKPEQFTQPLLDRHGLPKFDLLVCGDTLPERKPDPAQLLYCLEKLGCSADEAIMVGDSVNDIKASKAARVPIICVNYGYHQGEDLLDYWPDKLIESFDELVS